MYLLLLLNYKNYADVNFLWWADNKTMTLIVNGFSKPILKTDLENLVACQLAFSKCIAWQLCEWMNVSVGLS